MFIAGRAVAGIGASGVASSGFVIVLTVSSEKAKPLLLGICSSCFALGLILAPVIGGAFTEKASWRWCFWVNLPPGALTLLSMLFFFKPPSIQRDQTLLQCIKSLDLIGCGMFIPAIFMLLLAMMWGGTQKDWDSATIIGLFVGSGAMLMVFVAWEYYKGDGAMIPGNLLGRRTVIFSVLFSFCHFGSLGIVNYYLPEWFQAVQGTSPLESGTRVLAAMLSQIVGTLAAGILARKIDFYNPWLFAGPLFICTATALYTQFTAFNTPSSHWIGFQVIQGLGVGMAQQMPSLIVQLEVHDKPDLLPVGVSLNLFFQYLGATVTQVLGGIVFRSVLGNELAHHAGLSASKSPCYPLLEPPIYFLAVTTSATALFLAFGVKWIRIRGQKSTELESRELEQQ
ncbi:hypothetical protein PENANT_c015G03846 [Penicillium antarcticum]|uniref:Major facilitator superfamily (MFS) profile domain-containing protein n=1 Tax=Penicillium antarcticum TaxID=416450 RepID=A0A1V6Q3M5_9EURO|nr:hypothetical protein PENANT_c015G03846 [Penicillium antarcticum]